MSRSHLNIWTPLTQGRGQIPNMNDFTQSEKKRLDTLVDNASFAVLNKNLDASIKMAEILIKSNWRSIEDESGKGYILFLPKSN